MENILPIKLKLPPHFLEEEVLCDYTVSTHMKKVWAVELDLLNEFIAVCDTYNLRYSVFGGTLLGAIRHQGFIPWDNDLDVIMPRKDYDKLLEIAPSVFKHPYFFQTPATDNGRYFYFWSKLCNSQTTGRGEVDFAARQNGGIFIDIFTLDTIPTNKCAQWILNKKLTFIGKMTPFSGTWYQPHKRNLKQKILRAARFLFHLCIWKRPSAKQLFARFNKVAALYVNQNLPLCSYLNHARLSRNRIWKAKDWQEYEKRPFEMLMVNVPKNYDAILKVQYGDYMQFPPLSQRECHEYYDFEPEIPYYEYFSRKGCEYKDIDDFYK